MCADVGLVAAATAAGVVQVLAYRYCAAVVSSERARCAVGGGDEIVHMWWYRGSSRSLSRG